MVMVDGERVAVAVFGEGDSNDGGNGGCCGGVGCKGDRQWWLELVEVLNGVG